jgi:SAM-dependent methyltransferase
MKRTKINDLINFSIIAKMLIEDNEKVYDYLELTGEEITQAKLLKPFMKYNSVFVSDDKITKYALLREGLDNYFELFLCNIFRDLGITNKKGNFLDFGAGNGIYSKEFKRDNPDATIFQLEKESGMCIDFEKDKDWEKDFIEHFDFVLLSEILHCKGLPGRIAIMKSVNKVLKKGGTLIINENEDIFMDYRLKLLTPGGSMMTINDIESVVSYPRFKLKKTIKILNHNVLLYEKI